MAKDLTNQQFGHLTVLGLDTDKSQKILAKSYWLCKCDCGSGIIKSIRGDHLTSGDTVSCGCEQKNKGGRKSIDLLGQQFGRLTVIEKSNKTNSSGHTFWKCKCSCGNTVEVNGTNLRNGDTQSCGCLKHEVLSNLYKELGKQRKSNLEGQKFGKLTVIQDSGERSNNQVLWICKCDCGKIVKVITGNLTSGHTFSCGCIGKSKQEKMIEELLTTNNFIFITQYNICDQLKADFFIDNKYIIEYDGLQHFIYKNNYGWNNQDNFNKTRERDLRKNKYCFEHNIPIIRIPYDTEYTIDDLRLETTRFLLTPENEKEYYERLVGVR